MHHRAGAHLLLAVDDALEKYVGRQLLLALAALGHHPGGVAHLHGVEAIHAGSTHAVGQQLRGLVGVAVALAGHALVGGAGFRRRGAQHGQHVRVGFKRGAVHVAGRYQAAPGSD